MQWNKLLSQTGFRKVGELYINPVTGRTNTRSTALNNAASLVGYKDYAAAREAYSSKAYKRISGFAKEAKQQHNILDIRAAIKSGKVVDPKLLKGANQKFDAEFEKLFAKAWQDRNKKTRAGKPAKSYNLTKLLKHVEKLPKSYRDPYGNPL